MYNLSLTACSFYLKKANSKGDTKVCNLNHPLDIRVNGNQTFHFKDLSDIFISFFQKYQSFYKNDEKQQSYFCEYSPTSFVDTLDFRMYYVKIYSGYYGSSSNIIDGNTQKIKYKKAASDIDIRPFYLMVIFPKDSIQMVVQKGMLIFQNVGQFGVKTITTSLMQKYFSNEFGLTLTCRTISPELFIQKVIREDNIKKLVMVKNVKSSDVADNINKGYGLEVREISNLHFSPNMWKKLMERIRYVAGNRYNLFEFEQQEYDNLKVIVDIGGRSRTINLHNIDNLSIIESIPDNIKMADGHPNESMLIEYFIKVASEYLEEMVLHIA